MLLQFCPRPRKGYRKKSDFKVRISSYACYSDLCSV